jgi:hypothetical protein
MLCGAAPYTEKIGKTEKTFMLQMKWFNQLVWAIMYVIRILGDRVWESVAREKYGSESMCGVLQRRVEVRAKRWGNDNSTVF